MTFLSFIYSPNGFLYTLFGILTIFEKPAEGAIAASRGTTHVNKSLLCQFRLKKVASFFSTCWQRKKINEKYRENELCRTA